MPLPVLAAGAAAKIGGAGIVSKIGTALLGTPLRAVLTGAVGGKLLGI